MSHDEWIFTCESSVTFNKQNKFSQKYLPYNNNYYNFGV